MHKARYLFCLCCLAFIPASSQRKLPVKLSRLYLQWGYNRDWFTRSDLHFQSAQYNFTVHDAAAHDKPDFDAFWESPWDITIPQNSFRIGLYLNAAHTHAIEINFDHAKYVVAQYQQVHVSGQIYGKSIHKDTIISPSFLQFEHTDGANLYHINYVSQHTYMRHAKSIRATWLYKLGAGVVVPRSNVSILGIPVSNKYRLAGYVISIETGSRLYLSPRFFMELNVKDGFANYLDVLSAKGVTAHHHFGYFEIIGLAGYNISFLK